ncbi:MAG TPA: sialidase family protein [Candidatus Limnocylindrales bacterium]|nr:sialidase family protein [Candidatus Limnocylindrales bacterium]
MSKRWFRHGRIVAALPSAIVVVAIATTAVLAAPPAPSFTSPIRLGFQAGDDWEPSIAADDLGHVYALWTHYVGFGGADSGEIDPSCPDCPSPHMVIQISGDNGATWGEPHALAPSETRQDDPQIVVDALDGRTIYAAYMEGDKSSMFVSRSDDFGRTFEPVLVEDIERGLDKIALAARDGHVYLVYHSQQKIWASISHDGGETWSVVQPVRNTNSELGVSLPSGAAIAADGTAYFAWNGVNRPGQAKGAKTLYVTKTADGGSTWTTSIVDVSARPPLCDCGGWDYWGAQMAIGVDDLGRVYVLWNATATTGAPTRMFFARSTDGAITWSRAQDVSRAPAGSNNVFPALVSGGSGDVRIAWTDDRNGFDAGGDDPDARWNTYYRRSSDGGTTWSAEAQLSAFVTGFSYKFDTPADGYLEPYGDYLELDISAAGRTVAVWGEGNSYVGPGNIWYARE